MHLNASRPIMSTHAPPVLDLATHALFLDLDGTLVDIADTPSDVAASAELLDTLRRLAPRMDGALALITGRTIADADRVLNNMVAHIAGVHGAELRASRAPPDPRMHAAEADVAHALAAQAIPARAEFKGASIALHYRHAPQCADAVRGLARDIAARHGLQTLPGKMVLEIIDGARTKGGALDAFMQTAPFVGRTPIAIGDDVTDEAAFAAAAAHGGFAVLVGGERDTVARFRLGGPRDVLAWLQGPLA